MSEPLKVYRIHADDNVVIALRALPAGEVIPGEDGPVTLPAAVRLGAKIAVRPLRAGEKILKFGEPIGSLTKDVPTGGHVHTHNLSSDFIPTRERRHGEG